jgi:hypothetical protein
MAVRTKTDMITDQRDRLSDETVNLGFREFREDIVVVVVFPSGKERRRIQKTTT